MKALKFFVVTAIFLIVISIGYAQAGTPTYVPPDGQIFFFLGEELGAVGG
jgi:hypothetical protein